LEHGRKAGAVIGRGQSGDTLVEVLICIFLVSLVLGGAYATTHRSVQGVRNAQERGEALTLSQAQLEQVRQNASSATPDVFTHAGGFCMVDSTVKPAESDECKQTAGGSTAQAEQLGYRLTVTRTSCTLTPNCFKFAVRAEWDSVTGNGPVTTQLFERLYRRASPTPAPSPTPLACTNYNDIIFVLDGSSSMDMAWDSGSRLDKLIEVSKYLVQNLGISYTRNHAGIVRFWLASSVEQGLTGNVAALNSRLDGLSTVRGTVYLNALNTADAEFQSANARPAANKVVIFVSDGDPSDNVSLIAAKAADMKSRGIAIFTIGITNDGADIAVLQTMAGGGGTFAAAESEADLDALANTLASTLVCP
jgi:Tfp pilus assembly protein PilV/uncharacterized protein YegL